MRQESFRETFPRCIYPDICPYHNAAMEVLRLAVNIVLPEIWAIEFGTDGLPSHFLALFP